MHNSILIKEKQVFIPKFDNSLSCIKQVQNSICSQSNSGEVPLRFSMIKSDESGYNCEIEMIQTDSRSLLEGELSIFNYRQRSTERTNQFNAVMLIPTGINCDIGGHAGDATPSAKLLASVCDNLVIHPNVVNASDINEQPINALYVEGSVICRLLMGKVALQKVRSNRVLLVTEHRSDAPQIVDMTVNCASGARATLGVDIPRIVVLKKELLMKMCMSESGRATGDISQMDALLEVLAKYRDEYDAVALATKITPSGDTVALHHSYFSGEGPNPWGGVEAALTHTISMLFNVPSAHGPTISKLDLLMESFGQVDPRKAAEVVSMTYLFCVLKGLHKAPRVLNNHPGSYDPSVISAEDISCLVIPDGTVGLPTLAALEQGIPVIAVRQNKNMMRNDLQSLPFKPGKLFIVDNYFEAAGLMSALKTGITPSAIYRPIKNTVVDYYVKNIASSASTIENHQTRKKIS